MVLEKRNFTVIINSKKYGSYSASSPSLAAKKVKNKNGEFYLKETTKGSKKKVYGPYLSKKKIVQKGGDPRKEICESILLVFLNSTELPHLDDDKNSLDNALKIFGISVHKNRYLILRKIIVRRMSIDKKPNLCELLCSESDEEIESETDFYRDETYKKDIPPGILTKEKWISFINYFRKQINNSNRRQYICREILHLLNNCDNEKIAEENKPFFNNLYTILEILRKTIRPCIILKGILQLRNSFDEGYECNPKNYSLFNVLCSDNPDILLIEMNIVLTNYELFKNKLYNTLKSRDEMIQIWNNFIECLIRKIKTIEGIKKNEENIQEKWLKNQKAIISAVKKHNENNFNGWLKSQQAIISAAGPAVNLQPSDGLAVANNNNKLRFNNQNLHRKTPNWLKEEDSGVNLSASILTNKEHQEMMNHVRAHSGLFTAVRPTTNRRPIQPFEVLFTTPPNKQPNTRTLEERLAALLNN